MIVHLDFFVLVFFVLGILFFRSCTEKDILRQVLYGGIECVGQFPSVRLYRHVRRTVHSHLKREIPKYHFGMVYKIAVYTCPMLDFLRC